MRTSNLRTLRRLGALLLLLLVPLAACGGDDGGTDDATDTTEAAAPDAAYPVTIEHSGGTTTIEERPERIVSLNVQWTDAVLALGEVPVAYMVDSAQGELGVYPWQEDRLDGAEEITANGGIPFEQIAALDPDLILATFAITDPAQLETLQQIAPTIGNLSDVVDPWQDHIEVIGDVLGEPAEAQEVIDELEGRIEALAEELPGLEGKTYVAANYVEGDSIYVVADPEDGAAKLFYALGMSIPSSILELDGAEFGRVQLSLEQVALLDADFIGLLSNGSDMGKLPGWAQLPAVQRDAVVDFELVDVIGLNTPSALSLPYVIDLMRPALEAVAGS